ncbi:MAG: flagellar hook capping protein [Proteobacteria bacterium]|nr:flagellar hook capping protein [Pseudomonadota bacterium]
MSVNVQTLDSLGLTAKTASGSGTTKSNAMGQDMFLKLMMTQLEKQNPLKPQDSSEFLSQLAQFTMVTGIQDMQKSFTSLADSMNEGQALQAASLVGKNVLVASDQAVLGTTGGFGGELELPSEATDVSVRVVGSNGATIRSLDLGAQPAGTTSFHWDGLLDDGVTSADPGSYTLKAEAQINGETVALEPHVVAPVQSVTLGGANGVEIDLGVLGRHGLADILEVM